MSLFICMRPGCNNIENTNLVTAKLGINNKFPNMYRSEMMGIGSKTITNPNGDFIKHKEDILMLCCECNCGIGHGEFEYSKATEDEKRLASISKYNMITPYDHGDLIIKDNKAPHGYRTKNDEDYHYDKIRRKSTAKFMSIMTSLGINMNDFIKRKNNYINDKKSETTSNKLIFKAEIKRRIKSLNKEIQVSKDVCRLSELKHQLLEAKNLYKTS